MGRLCFGFGFFLSVLVFCNIILAHTYLTTLSNTQSELKIHLFLIPEILNTKLIEDVWNQ